MKKLITLLLALVATNTLWAYDFSVNGIYYNILTDKTNEVEVASGYPKYTGDIIIPSSVTYNGSTYSVTTIGNHAFGACYSLKSINIPNSVTSIGEGAFQYCYDLASISVAAGNTTYDSRDNCNAIIETETNRLISSLATMVMTDKVEAKDPFWNNSAKNLLEGLIGLFLEEYKDNKIKRKPSN